MKLVNESELESALEDINYDTPLNADYGVRIIKVSDIIGAVGPLAKKYSIEPNLRNNEYRELIRAAQDYLQADGRWQFAVLEGIGKCLTTV